MAGPEIGPETRGRGGRPGILDRTGAREKERRKPCGKRNTMGETICVYVFIASRKQRHKRQAGGA
eukprot:scaffold14074_cov111-Isochrysis_galbana.AAC.2